MRAAISRCLPGVEPVGTRWALSPLRGRTRGIERLSGGVRRGRSPTLSSLERPPANRWTFSGVRWVGTHAAGARKSRHHAELAAGRASLADDRRALAADDDHAGRTDADESRRTRPAARRTVTARVDRDRGPRGRTVFDGAATRRPSRLRGDGERARRLAAASAQIVRRGAIGADSAPAAPPKRGQLFARPETNPSCLRKGPRQLSWRGLFLVVNFEAKAGGREETWARARRGR